VVPNLQVDENGQPLPAKLISDSGRSYNVAFRTDVDWKSANQKTVGELLAGFFAHYGQTFDWGGYVVSMRRGSTSKAPDIPRQQWVIEDPFETWRNLAGQCNEGKCLILNALRHGFAMVKAQSLKSLWQLCPPRFGPERYFLRVPINGIQDESFGMWILHTLRSRLPDRTSPKCLVQCVREKPFKRDIFLEFPNREARLRGLSVAQQASQGAWRFYAVGGDCFLNALGEASMVTTKLP
jgi:hypothetical protein